MSRLLCNILLILLMFPSAGLIWFLAASFLYRRTDMSWYESTLWSGCAAAIYAAAYWFMVWRRLVQWTPLRVGITLGSFALLAGLAVVIGQRGNDWRRREHVIGGVAGPCILWLIVTTLTWRETAAERAKRIRAASRGAVVCPTCGYNLTGLREARCPECGTQFTLDELLAQQPSRVGAELEK